MTKKPFVIDLVLSRHFPAIRTSCYRAILLTPLSQVTDQSRLCHSGICHIPTAPIITLQYPTKAAPLALTAPLPTYYSRHREQLTAGRAAQTGLSLH